MTATAAERRAARAEARREEILDAAQRIFAAQGYNETGIADIAADLGIGHGTFYRYFDNKRDIAEQVLDRAILSILTPLAEEDPHASTTVEEYREQTLRIMLRMFETLEAQPDTFALLQVQSLAIDPEASHRSFEVFSARTAQFLQNGVDRGFLRRELDVEITAQALVGLIFEGTRRAIAEDAPRELWRRWVDAGVALMFNGVAA
ncbi:MAG: helix-turn-helix domain-containing protein [Solirubrobacterales bacterium]